MDEYIVITEIAILLDFLKMIKHLVIPFITSACTLYFPENYAKLSRMTISRNIISRDYFQILLKIGVFKNLTKFTRKHFSWSLFLNKITGLTPATLLKKEAPTEVFSREIFKILRTLFL